MLIPNPGLTLSPLTVQSGRAVGAHDGGIPSAAMSTIRRKIREAKNDLTSAVNRLATAIVKAETDHGYA